MTICGCFECPLRHRTMDICGASINKFEYWWNMKLPSQKDAFPEWCPLKDVEKERSK